MGTLIQGGRIVTAVEDFLGDVYFDNGQVTALGKDLSGFRRPGDTVIDARGRILFPGGIDAHTHMELPFMGTVSTDDFKDGTVAAAMGGTTSIIDFVIPSREQSLGEAYGQWMEKAQGKAVVDFGFHMSVTNWNETIAREIPEMVAKGMTSFKTFMAYKGVLGVDDGQLFQVLRAVQAAGGLVTVHAVNGDVLQVLAAEFLREGKTAPVWHARAQPPIMEGEAVQRAIELARLAEAGLLIVHMSCDEAVQGLREARRRALPVWGETCIQYLLLSEDLYEQEGFEGAKYVLSPPIRPKAGLESMWRALADGTLSTIATDHCPFNFVGQKDRGKGDFTKIPNGLAAVEERLPLLWTYGVEAGRITAQRFVQVTSTNVAKIFGLFPQKGTIAVGSDADVVVWDPTWEGTISAKTHASKVDYSCYEGFHQKGRAEHVFVRGEPVVQGCRFVGRAGFGRYLSRKRFDARATL